MEVPTKIPDKEIGDMIADLMYTDEYPDRRRLCLALIQFRDLQRRWDMFAWCFPWMEKWMIWLSRKRARP